MPACGLERGGDDPLLSLVLPAFNPGSAVEQTWCSIQEFLRQADDDWEVVFVCDGCTDGTAELLTSLSKGATDRVRILAYAPNRGKGYAVRRGLQAARGWWRLFTDVDLAYGFDDILRVAAALRAGADVAIASRVHPDSRLLIPPSLQGYAYRRHLQSLAFSAIVRLILPLTHRDTQAGLKGMSAAAASQLLPRLQSDGFELDCELLTACVRLGLQIVEVPVCVRYHTSASTTGLATMGRMVRSLWRIRRAWSVDRVAVTSAAGARKPDPTLRRAA